jgi:hypothetical protein
MWQLYGVVFLYEHNDFKYNDDKAALWMVVVVV